MAEQADKPGVRIRIHPMMQYLTGGQEAVEVEGRNVKNCLLDLERRFPGTADHVFDKKGNLQRQVEILINGVSAFPDELGASVHKGDEISILMMLSGG